MCRGNRTNLRFGIAAIDLGTYFWGRLRAEYSKSPAWVPAGFGPSRFGTHPDKLFQGDGAAVAAVAEVYQRFRSPENLLDIASV